ncbi:MAG TPA: exonuclease SbcCD subunit D [Pyrinomonadaceae bacterium]|jgi:DNA repair exonuclease SbcCD nuclease subunit
MKFLHVSDIHLGCTRYQLNESPRDFFDAWIDVIKKYAIGEKVDFVVMAGDFFHKRNVPPETMNYAFAGLSLLRDAGIPVITIEGNHDQKHNDSEYSWLRSLANWNLLYLLEPKNVEGKMFYEAWDEEFGKGGFVDIGNARIFGSNWYGASANWAIPMLTKALKDNRRAGAFHILLLHTDVEGHQTHPIPALSLVNLKELKEVTDYVALGHTHKHYEIDNWAFNPGSLEITSIDEYRETRGAFLVEVDEQNQITARHVRDYHQRPFQRLSFDVSRCQEAKEVTEGVLEMVKNQARGASQTMNDERGTMNAEGNLVNEEGEPINEVREMMKAKREMANSENELTNSSFRVHHSSFSLPPIIEITLRGHLGFPNSLLELKTIREEAQRLTNALHVRIKNHSAPVEYAVAADLEEDASREKLERRVIEDLIVRDNRYKTRVENISEAVIGAKRMALSDDEPEKIVDFISMKITENSEVRTEN